MENANPKVDAFLDRLPAWREECEKLRAIVLECPLNEEFKWGNPCYSHSGRNIVLIHVFKEYCALLFFKGALLKDPKGILIQQTENVQAARQIRFTHIGEIQKQKAAIKSLIQQAIEVESSGQKVEFKKTGEFPMPVEFKQALKKMPALKTAFAALTHGRQRAYLLHFSSAKQSQTREARIEKVIPKILDGFGLND